MQPFLTREEFEQEILEKLQRFSERKIRNIGKITKKDFVKRIDQLFGQDEALSRKTDLIAQTTKLNVETVELLIRASLEFSYNNYKVDTGRLERENSELRQELRRAQTKSRAREEIFSKKENALKSKERIEIRKKTEKLDKLNKENNSLKSQLAKQKKEIKKSAQDKEKDKHLADQKEQGKKSRDNGKKDKTVIKKTFDAEESNKDANHFHEITLYDIPARYDEEEVVTALKKIGKIKTVSLKKQYKYQTIKTCIELDEVHKNLFKAGKLKVDLLFKKGEKEIIIQARWFDGKMTVQEIKERCRWKAYKVIHNSFLRDVAKDSYSYEYGKFVRFGKKLVFLAFFKTKEEMLEAQEKSKRIEKNEKDRIWIIHGSGKRKTRGRIVETQKNGTPSSDDTIARSTTSPPKEVDEKDSIISKDNQPSTEEKDITMISVEKTVEMINSYRTGELEEWLDKENEKIEKQALKKDNVPTEKVVKIIRDLREDLVKEGNDNKEEASTQQEETGKIESIVSLGDSEEEIRARLEEIRTRRQVIDKIGEDIRPLDAITRGVNCSKPRPITEAEFNYYNDVNKSCATRLAIANLAEKFKTSNKKGRKKVSDDDDDSEDKEVIEIKDDESDNEVRKGSYESRRTKKHTKKKRKQKSTV